MRLRTSQAYRVFHVPYSFYELSAYLLPYQSEEKIAAEKVFFSRIETIATIGQTSISTPPVKIRSSALEISSLISITEPLFCADSPGIRIWASV